MRGIQSDGSLWCWGSNASGQLGVASGTTGTPVHVDANSWLAVSTGSQFTCGIHSDGSLWCWGDGTRGAQLTPTAIVPAP